jgi:hypothetical protein
MRGRLRCQAAEWRRWVRNPLILKWVEEGFDLAWKHRFPPPSFEAANHASVWEHADFVDQAIADLLAAQSILKVTRKPHMVCPLGVVVQGEKKHLSTHPGVPL